MDTNEYVMPALESNSSREDVAYSPAASSPVTEPQTRLEEELSYLRKQNEILQDTIRMQQASKQHLPSSQPTETTDREDIFSSLEDDAFITGAQAKRLKQELSEYKKSLNEIKEGIVDYMAQQEVRKIHSLYPTFEQDMQQLPSILAKNPDLAAEYKRNPSPHFAMTIVKAHGKGSQRTDIQRMVENRKQSGSLSSIGGSTVDKANDWKNMSRKEFLKFTKSN